METYSNLVPMDLQDELIVLRDTISKAYFRIGDIVNQVIKENPTSERMALYNAVGSFVGKASRTVREYAMVSAFFPAEIREFYEVLTFDHFRAAMKYGDSCYEALGWALAQVEELNRPATVDAMESAFEEQKSSLNFMEERKASAESTLLYILNKLKEILHFHKVRLTDDLVVDAIKVIDRIEIQLEKEKVIVVE